MRRVCAESALVANGTGTSIKHIGVRVKVGVDESSGRRWWIRKKRFQIRIIPELGVGVRHVDGDLCYASLFDQYSNPPWQSNDE